MAKVVNRTSTDKPTSLTPGMFFKNNRNGDVCILVAINGEWYLANVENGYGWDGCDIEGLTVKQVEDREDMTLLQVNQVIFE